ncbi:MAG: YfhO family protein [Pseudobutyrivibrio sp.]|nr:YfhO family protein [Pseudobutyrivibrio sp.]
MPESLSNLLKYARIGVNNSVCEVNMTANFSIRKIFSNKVILTGLLCFLLAFLSLILFVIQGDGFFIIRDDFNQQQIPFTTGLHQSVIDSGFSGFSWCVDLGSSTLQAYSFYEMGSPFFWLSMLFPAHAFPYVVAWIYMLKYTVAGIFAFLYLKRFLNQEKWAILGAVLYAFSGFSTVNLMYYHFHDVIALFPLLLIGLEILIEKKDIRLFVFSVFLNAFLNYFFFIGEAIFLIVYYLFRFSRKAVRGMVKEILRCVSGAMLGVGMAAVLFIPSILYIMQNSRSKSDFSSEGLFNNFRYILFNLKGIILPAESMPDMSAIFPSKFYSTAAYLPMIGLILVIAYIIKNRDWLSRLLIFCIIGAFWPAIGNGFFLYMDCQNRWWHAFVMMMVLASCQVLESLQDYKPAIKVSSMINSLLIVFLFVTVFFFFKDPEGASTVYSASRFTVYTLIAFLGIGATVICLTCFKGSFKILLLGVSGFAVVTTALTLYVYRSKGTDISSYKELYDVACQINLPDDQYRINNASNVVSMVNNTSGFSLFTSTDSVGVTTFEEVFDYNDAVNGLNKNEYPGLAQLLAGRYYISTEADGNNIVTTYDSNGTTYYLLETNACPIGYKIDSYISESELKSLPIENRAIALLQAAVVTDSKDAPASVSQVSARDINMDASIDELVAKAKENAVFDFTKDGHGFSCKSNYDETSTIYFSVPYDTGWSATIDGSEAHIVQSGGLMLLEVPAGQHDIVFTYVTPYYKVGLFISLACWVLFLILLAISKPKNI